MKQIIKLNSTVEIDLQKLLESKALLQANSGGGKSWLIRRILEQSHGKVQQIVIDPEGEFSTLREKFDYVLAGKGGDTPADPRSAALLARKLLELNVSAIIDLYELPPQERKRFVHLFVDALVNAPKELWHPVLIVIDEAHVFVPEKDQSEAAGPINDLASRGRKRGFGLILATQRISKLAKDSAAECNNKLIGRTSLDIDMKRAAEELGMTSKEEYFSLRKIAPGNFLAFGPAISDEVIEVKVGPVETSHPKAGVQATKVAPPTAGIRKILGQLADLPKEAQEEAHTISEYKMQVTNLKRELTIATQKANAPRPEPTKVQKMVVPMIGKRTIERIVKFEGIMRKMIRDAKVVFAASEGNVDRFEQDLDKMMAQFQMVLKKGENITLPVQPMPRYQKVDVKFETTSGEALSGPEQRVLDAIAWCESIGNQRPPNELVAFLSGYSHFRSTGYTNPRGYLKTKGLIGYSGGAIYLTDTGRRMATTPSAPLTQQALHQVVLDKLDGPERKLLKPLLEAYPHGISNSGLCATAGYMHEKSTGYTNPRGRLKSFGLIEYDSGIVKAKSLLFIE